MDCLSGSGANNASLDYLTLVGFLPGAHIKTGATSRIVSGIAGVVRQPNNVFDAEAVACLEHEHLELASAAQGEGSSRALRELLRSFDTVMTSGHLSTKISQT